MKQRPYVALLATLLLGSLHGCAGQPVGQDKIQPEVQRLAKDSSAGRQPVLLRLSSMATAEQLQQLRDLGVVLGAVTGPVVSASVTPEQLKAVAALPFVQQIEASRIRPKRQ